jgi:AraC-like DNA-binding protein
MIVARALENELYFFEYLSTRDEMSESAYYFHTHQGIEILYVYEGSGQVILDDRFYAVHPRTLLIFKPFQLHYIRMDVPPKYTCSLIKVKPIFMEQCASVFPQCHDLISGFLNDDGSSQIFGLNEAQHAQLHEKFRNLNEILQTSGSRQLHEEAVILFLFTFFVNLVTTVMPNAEAGKPVKPLRTTQHIGGILKWIDAHYKERYTLDRLAEELHFSVSYMSKLFRRQTGKSIHEYITEKRLDQARLLLHTPKSVEAISEETGFHSPSHFIRTFKAKYGVPPHQYRLGAAERYIPPE